MIIFSLKYLSIFDCINLTKTTDPTCMRGTLVHGYERIVINYFTCACEIKLPWSFYASIRAYYLINYITKVWTNFPKICVCICTSGIHMQIRADVTQIRRNYHFLKRIIKFWTITRSAQVSVYMGCIYEYVYVSRHVRDTTEVQTNQSVWMTLMMMSGCIRGCSRYIIHAQVHGCIIY